MENKKCRVEYLYPTLEKSELERLDVLEDYESLNFLAGEKEIIESIQFVDFDIFAFPEFYNMKWKKENIEKGARILVNYPEYIPVYIGQSARIIMNELLGVQQFYLNDLAQKDTKESYYLQGKMHLAIFLSVIEQLEKNGINLAELPVFYSQFVFVGLDKFSNLANNVKDIDRAIYQHSSNGNSNWYQMMEKYCYYKNLDDFLNNVKKIVSRVEMNAMMPNPEVLDFGENKYFASEIFDLYLKNRDYKFHLSLEDSLRIDEIRKLPQGDMVSITSYIDKILEELISGAKIAEKRVMMNYIKEIIDKIRNCKQKEKEDLVKKLKELLDGIPLNEETKEEWESVIGKERLENLLNDIYTLFENDEKDNLQKEINTLKNKLIQKLLEELKNKSRRAEQDNLINQIKNILPGVELTEENKTLMKDILKDDKVWLNVTCVEKTKEELQKEIDELKKSLNEKEQELAEIKKIVLDYLNHGIKNKKLLANNLSTEEIKQLLKNYQAKNNISRIRKNLLLAALTFSIIGIAIVGFKNDKNSKSTINVESSQSNEFNNSSDDNFDNTIDNTQSNDLFIEKDLESSASPSSNLDIVDEYKKSIYLGKPMDTQGVSYYESIYDEESKGTINKKGFISGYFPYIFTDNGIHYYSALRSEEEVLNFIDEHIDNINEIHWKVAFTQEIYKDEVENLLENGQSINSSYTTCFVDFEPDLKDQIRLRK